MLFVLVAASGTGVVLSRTPRRQVLAMAANGLVLALLFMALQAPDVAFSELVVGAAALPLLFLVVLASIKMDRGRAMSRRVRLLVFALAVLCALPAVWRVARAHAALRRPCAALRRRDQRRRAARAARHQHGDAR